VRRRDAIVSLAAAAAGCARRTTVDVPGAYTRAWRPRPALVSADRIIRTVAGLRPYRPSGFVLRAEREGVKTLIHNYGHGGGGVTLSWGTAEMAVDLASKTGEKAFAVAGCGAVGLATARLLQRRGSDVTIYAKALPPNTTSNIAGAQWWPTSVFDPDRRTPEFTEQFLLAARLSYNYFQTMVGSYYGIRWTPNFRLSDDPPPDRWLLGPTSPLRSMYPEFRDFGPGEHAFPAAYARRWMSMMIEPPVYLNAVMRDFLLAGGRIVVRSFASREEMLSLKEPVIMNCTGLGSRDLFGDPELIPAKGQLTVLLPQPEVDYNLLKSGLYMFPRTDGILLGGTFQTQEWSLEPDREAEKQIVAAHAELFGRFTNPGSKSSRPVS
jgi:D-amino-acid oxidase